MPDDIFEHPRLVAIYDTLDPDRSDLDVYVAIAGELGASRVLDVGCGTGTFALLLAERGLEVIGVDPAGRSLVAHGYSVEEVRDAPDRPGREFVFFAQRPGGGQEWVAGE